MQLPRLSSGLALLRCDARGWLLPTDDYLRGFLELPQLALVDEAGPAEIAWHAALRAAPGAPLAPAALAAIEDDDARANHAMFMTFRDALLAAGTLEACYLALMRSGHVNVPPLFIDLVVQAIVEHLMRSSVDPFELRAAELLVRPQRISVVEGQIFAADREAVDALNGSIGFDLRSLLGHADTPLHGAGMDVLTLDNASRFMRLVELDRASGQGHAPAFVQASAGRIHDDHPRHAFLLDMTHEIGNDLGHGMSFRMTRANSGLTALSRVLERWVRHFFGLSVTITPLRRIDDPEWSWHLGLDVESSALLNELYAGSTIEPARIERLLSLFRLDFDDPHDMLERVAGKPVYLGLARAADHTLRLKPQNLLLNLPLALRR